MPPLKTRPCTEVYMNLPPDDHAPKFLEREIIKYNQFEAGRVKGRVYLPRDEVRAIIKELIKSSILDSKRAKRLSSKRDSEQKKRPKVTRRDAVNRKRRLIAACIQNYQKLNLKRVAKFTKSCYNTVLSVYRNLRAGNPVDTYNYNNLPELNQVEELEKDVKLADGGLITVTDLKRNHPTFSRKKILKILHSHDLRWRKLPLAEPKFATFDPPDQNSVNRIICNMATVHKNPEMQMLYVDEIKFPLNQTAKFHWIHRDAQSNIKLNRREVPDSTITAIALCSTHKFLAVQLFRGEINSNDFLNFLNEVFTKLPPDKKYLVLADNATWHNSAILQKSAAYQYLYFNVPRMYQLNLIENAFSAVRAEFRKRRTVQTLEEEAKLIVDLFHSVHNVERFQGYWRNHLRMLDKYYK